MVLTERSDGDWVGDTCESAEHMKESFGSARVVFRFRKTVEKNYSSQVWNEHWIREELGFYHRM